MHKPVTNIAALFLVAAASAVSVAAAAADGQQVYEATCSRCHDTGKMGAPVLAELSDWTDYTDVVWSDVYQLHLEDGMLRTVEDDPQKGISEEQMEAATSYIMSVVNKK